MGDGDPRGPYGDPRGPSGTLPKRKMGTSSSQMTPQTSDSDKNQGSCIENSVGEKVAYMDVSEFLFFQEESPFLCQSDVI